MSEFVDKVVRITDTAAQRQDRKRLADTAMHRASGEAALEILGEFLGFEKGDRKTRVTGQDIADIIYRKMREAREL